jgi:hypothetical protein
VIPSHAVEQRQRELRDDLQLLILAPLLGPFGVLEALVERTPVLPKVRRETQAIDVGPGSVVELVIARSAAPSWSGSRHGKKQR